MDSRRFDTVAKLFADRRLSRRQALAQAGAGLAAGALAAAGFSAASAQDATPAASDEEQPFVHDAEMLFLQTYQSGSIVPVEGVDGRFTLTLEQGHGQTIYFSDRPDRIVGASPTPQFLEGLGFLPENPPNAALVVETAPGETDVAVVELFNPVYDPMTQGVTYEIEVLGNWQAELEMEFTEAPTDLAVLAPSFGAAQLFIDSCPDHDLVCYINPDANQHPTNTAVGTIPNSELDGYCYSWSLAGCYPCLPKTRTLDATVTYWKDQCNQRFTGCNGACSIWPVCSSGLSC